MQERQTKQKQIIYSALCALDHPTATEVFGVVHEEYPSVSRATVFRVLGGFVLGGKALELKLAVNETRYDYNVASHTHARCVHCGRVADVEVDGLPKEGLKARACGDFQVQGYVVEFFGTCKDCQEEISV